MPLNIDLIEKMDNPRVRQAVENLEYLKSIGLKPNEVLCLIKYSENEVLRKRVYDNLIQLLIDMETTETRSIVEPQLIKDLFPLVLTYSDDGFVKEWPAFFCRDIRQILIMIETTLKKRKEHGAMRVAVSSLCEKVLSRLDLSIRCVLEKENKEAE